MVLGDASGGGPGMKVQTFCETALEFKVIVDIYATGHFTPLSHTPHIQVVPGPPVLWKAVLPTLRRCGETFSLGIKAEDAWGNPSDGVDETLVFEGEPPVSGLPEKARFSPGQKAARVNGLKAEKPGVYRIRVYDTSGGLLVESNPIVIRAGELAGYWGDLLGHDRPLETT